MSGEYNCAAPYTRNPAESTLSEELDALDAKLAFIEQGLTVYFGVNSVTWAEMKAEAARLREQVEAAKTARATIRTTEIL